MAVFGATRALAQDGSNDDASTSEPDVASSASTRELPFDLHVFGRWSYGVTDGLVYSGGSEDGEFANASLALNMNYQLTRDVRIASQIELIEEPQEDELEVEIDFLFGTWGVSDSVSLRLGRVKQPYGLYAEVFDVGTVRPFLDLPLSVYGPSGVAGESIDGFAATFTRPLGDWGLAFDVYVGQLDLEASEPWESLREEDEDGDDDGDGDGDEGFEGLIEDKTRDDVLGGRLVFSSPSQLVRLGASAYRATSQGEGDEADEEVDDLVYSIHVELETDRTWVRAEAYHFHEEDEAKADGAYIEVAHFVDEHWQLAARWDWVDTEIEEVEIPEELESLTEHRDLALGLNYWISRGFVIKTAAHWVEGNRFALSEDFFEELEGDEPDGLEDETLLFEVGLQFSF